jgi:hypothetical protein
MLIYIATTFAAFGPFASDTTSKLTAWPSLKFLNPSALIAEK